MERRGIIFSNGDRPGVALADRLATLWFLAEAEGVVSSMIRELITEEMLMQSELYQSIIQKGIQQGLDKGIQQGLDKGIQQGLDKGMLISLRKTVERVLLRRGGALDPDVQARLRAETDLPLVESWCDEALSVLDAAGAARLAALIAKREAPRR